MRVKIYDELNQDRLLGSLPRPAANLGARYYRMQTCGPIRAVSFDEMTAIDTVYDIIEFTIGWRSSDDNWTMDAVFRTSAKLKHLMRLRDFRLPGESKSQAEYRWYAQ